jgi:hypothetical protein
MSRIENLVGCRNVLAGAFASAVMIAMSTSGAMAIVGCAGTAGTSGFTSNPVQLNLQCMQPIILPTTLHPLQSFGGSELVRTNSTTATYYLADRSNRGIIVVNATNMTFVKTMMPTTTGTSTPILNSIGAITGYSGKDPTGGFMGQSIYTASPANQATQRIGTVEEVNSGPSGMAVYVNPGDPNSNRWMLVTDGSCQINDNGGGYSSAAAGGSMRACSEPADPSVAGTLVVCASASCATQTLTGPATPYGSTSGVTNYVSQQNPLLSTANCTVPGPQYLASAGLPTKTVCYPQNHQSNIKLFDLKTNTYVAAFPTGGGCIDGGYQNSIGAGTFQVPMAPCTAPLGLYAPPSAAAPYGYSVTGKNGQANSVEPKIGVDSYAADPTTCPGGKVGGKGCVYVLVTSSNENTPRNIGCQLSQVFSPPTSCAQTPPLLGPATGANGGCSENGLAANAQNGNPTFIQPWDDVTPVNPAAGYATPGTGVQGQTGGPYLTLFSMDPGTGHLTYQATIKIDDHNSTNGPAIPPGVAGPMVPVGSPPAPALTSVLPNARQMIVESGFRGCDSKGRHGPEAFGNVVWDPQAGVGGAFLVAIPNVLNNPPICYIASLDNLCGPPTTNTNGVVITAANVTAQPVAVVVPPGPGAFSQNFWVQSYVPGPWIAGGDPSQGGAPAGGCVYPAPTPATNNYVASINNQNNGGFNWSCDGALAMIDPVYVDKSAKQPNILQLYPMSNPAGGYQVAVGQPYDGVIDANNTFPKVLAACPNFQTAAVTHNPYLPAMGATGSSICPNGLKSPGSATYVGGAYTGPTLGDGIVYHATAGSIGGVVYVPYCSPFSIELGPTDIPRGYDGLGAGDVSTLTQPSTGRTSTFANIFLGCNPFFNGNNAGTGQGQLTVNIQENYSLALNTISATSNPANGCTLGALGLGCRSVSQPQTAPLPTNPFGISAFNDFFLPGPYPAVDPVPLFAHYNNNVNTPIPAGCAAQYPATPPGNGGGTCGGTHPFVPPNVPSGPLCSSTTCPLATGNQVMAGIIAAPNNFNAATNINGVTAARLNMTNILKDPHWWVAVGGRGWTSASINPTPNPGGLATKGPVIGYIDVLTNQVVEYTPTSSGSNTIALDEQNYVAFLPVNGVLYSGLPAGDFTGNGARLCGNTTTVNGLTTGPGCIIVFRQQYLSPLGSSSRKGN